MFGGQRRFRLVACVCAVLAISAAACGDDGGETTERASVTTAESTTTSEATTTTEPAPEFEALPADPNLTPEQQVEAAYLHSWDILLDALGNARTDHLAQAFADRGLELATENVERLTDDGHVVEGPPEHNIRGVVVDGNNATLIDEYTNHLTLVDADSGEPIEADPDELVLRQYQFEKREGVWWVVGITS